MKTGTDKLLLGLLLALVTCYVIFLFTRSDDQPAHELPAFTTPNIDTPAIITVVADSTYPLIFQAAFTPSTEVRQGAQAFTFHTLNLGNLTVESGSIIACDEVNIFHAIPFTEQFPTGAFPVELAMAKISDIEQRVAFARIRFSNDSVARWEVALQAGQDSVSINDSLIYCYPVDAGIGLFIDSAANVRFSQGGQFEWDRAFMSERAQNSYTGFIHTFGAQNMAIFTTGYGDGCYTTYIGYNISGKPCCLLTDFELINWWTQRITNTL